MVRAVHEDRVHLIEVVCAAPRPLGEHGGHGVVGRVDVATGRIAAIEHRQVLHLPVVARRLAEPGERLAEVHNAVVRVAAGGGQVDLEQFRVPVDEHRNRARSLGRLSAGADGVFRDVGAHHDRLPADPVGGQVTQRRLEAVHAAETGLLELGHLAVAGQLAAPGCDQRVVDHALDDDRTRGIVTG
jgi:hypothetical protein